MSACDANTRLQLTRELLGSTLLIVLVALLLSALKIPVPEFVSGMILMAFLGMLKDAYSSYFKAREEIQAAKVEVAKAEAPKPPENP
jgi:hypothetical protein